MKNCKKYLIADALLNYSKDSITEFIEPSKDSELSKIAEEKGIVLPSPDLMLFRTIYAKCGEPNRNGVIINKGPVEKSLKTLISKQINLEHEGKNFVCGHILDAKLEGEYIVIYGVFYKSLFQEEYETLKELFADKKVYVSFEIWSRDPETGKSVMHDLENGTREINPILFHGCGLLLQHLPACKEAVLDKILGQKLLENAEQIVDKVFNEDLVYASFDYEESKCMHCQNCTCEKDKEVQKVEEIKLEEKVEENSTQEAKERLCPECKQPLKDEEKDLCAECLKKKEQSSEETKTEETPVETKTEETPKVEAETKVEEPKVEEKAEEKPEVAETKTEETKEEVVVEEKKEDATIVTTTQEVTKVDEIKPEGEIITTEVKTETIVVNDEGKETQKVIEEVKTVVTYTFEQVQDEVRKAQEEKDKEITQLKQELATKEQEIADLKNPKVEPKKEKEMTVGSVIVEGKSELKKQAEKINDIIAHKGDK